ncbi:MAG TPA: hypothetical protein PLT28_00120 [Saprospiraceae bacterium]|nr:hypothetical protein [Saprospiraceae bacterium]
MSHFTVAVFTKPHGKTLEELLAPYDENIVVPRYLKYTKADLIERGKQAIQEFATIGCYAQWKADPAAYEKEVNNEQHIHYLKDEFPQKLHWTDEEIYQDQIKYYDEDDIGENGEVYSTYNPLSQWDWYEVGGRFSNMISLKDGSKKVNSAQIKDTNFAGNQKEYQKAITEWELKVEGKLPQNHEEEYILKTSFYKAPYYTETYKDKETYASIMSHFGTYAVVTPDGEWHEKGQMGWWGLSSETPEESLDWDLNYKKRFLDTADPEWTITIVDCHI